MSGPADTAEARKAACLAALALPRAGDTLSALFQARAAQAPDRPFLHHGERRWSWRQTEAAMHHWARRLGAAGAVPGERVAVILPNSDLHVIVLLACAHVGAVFVPVNAELKPAEMAVALAIADPVCIVTTPSLHGAAETIAAALPARARTLLPVDLAALAVPDDDAAAARPTETVAQPDDNLAIVFTSGTTGTPKGVVHSHRTYVVAAEIAAYRMRLVPADCLLVVLPLFHLNALFYSVGGAIAAGARLVVEERFRASSFWQTVQRFGVTQVNIIAAVGNILLKRDRTEFPGNATLRKISAAPVSAAVAEALAQEFGITHVVESYGMTEAPGLAQVDFEDSQHRACLGRPIRHPLTGAPVSEIAVVDDDRQPVPSGAIGRLMVRAATMMKGYYNRPDLADRISPEGWFLTEDRGRMDEDGFFYFCGRTSEIIRSRGENIAASEIEAVLLSHPQVSDVGCIGVPSALGEEDIVAVAVPRDDTGIDAAGLVQHCRERLSRHKWPRYLVVCDRLPKTPTEKVARHLLRELPGLMERAIELPQGDAA